MYDEKSRKNHASARTDLNKLTMTDYDIRDAQFWNNYEFIVIGTHTHLSQKIFSSDFSHPNLFRKCWKMQNVKTRQEKRFLK